MSETFLERAEREGKAGTKHESPNRETTLNWLLKHTNELVIANSEYAIEIFESDEKDIIWGFVPRNKN
jgi:hypothetical protein